MSWKNRKYINLSGTAAGSVPFSGATIYSNDDVNSNKILLNKPLVENEHINDFDLHNKINGRKPFHFYGNKKEEPSSFLNPNISSYEKTFSLKNDDERFQEEYDFDKMKENEVEEIESLARKNWHEYAENVKESFQALETASFEREKNAKELKNKNKEMIEHSKDLLIQNKECYFPFYVGEVFDYTEHICERFDSRNAIQTLMKNITICQNDNSSQNKLNSFSQHAHGDISNAVIGKVILTQIRNDTDYHIGVTLFQDTACKIPIPGNKERWRDLERWFHFVIPPKFKNFKDHTIYISKKGEGDIYTELYPWLTPNEQSIQKGVINYNSTSYYVVPYHPIARIIMENCHIKKFWEKPKISTESGDTYGSYIIEKKTFAAAQKNLLDKIKNSIPITDLKQLTVKLEPIQFNDNSKSEYLNFDSSNHLGNDNLFLSMNFIYGFRN